MFREGHRLSQTPAETCKMGIFMKALSFGVAGAGIAIFRQEMAEAGGDAIRPTTLNWPHTGVFDAYAVE